MQVINVAIKTIIIAIKLRKNKPIKNRDKVFSSISKRGGLFLNRKDSIHFIVTFFLPQ